MPTDEQISILVDIATDGGAGLAPHKLPVVLDLVAADYVDVIGATADQRFKLTAKGQRLLSERGVGANES